MKNRRLISILDAFLIATGAILLWRGIWYLADIYLFPKTEWLSALTSILLGLIILISQRKFVERFR